MNIDQLKYFSSIFKLWVQSPIPQKLIYKMESLQSELSKLKYYYQYFIAYKQCICLHFIIK